MKTILSAILLSSSLLFTSSAFACGDEKECACKDKDAKHAAKHKKAHTHEDGFAMFSAKDLKGHLETNKTTVAVYDANSDKTRSKMGLVPDAKALKSYREYDLAVLPAKKDTLTVFYCSNEKCSASHTSAKRAMEAGYSNVAVLKTGIKGWKDAGYKTVAYKK